MQRLRQALTPWRALLLASLLLAAQAAGLAHRVAHGGPALGHAAVAEAWGHVQANDHGPGNGDVSAECRLYDQLLGHADVLLASLPPAPLPALVACVDVPVDAVLRVASAAAYQARAPPRG